jgi:hypothetical protein
VGSVLISNPHAYSPIAANNVLRIHYNFLHYAETYSDNRFADYWSGWRARSQSKAYIIKTGGGIAIAASDGWPLSKEEEFGLKWPDSVIGPSSSGLISAMRKLNATRDEFAIAISSHKSVVYIQAFIEYESLGTVMHRDKG